MRRKRKRWMRAAACLALFFLTPVLTGLVMNLVWVGEEPSLTEDVERFREMKVAAERMEGCENWGGKEYRKLARDYLYYDGSIKQGMKSVSPFSWYGMLLSGDKVDGYAKAFQTVLSDVKCFPVASDSQGKETVNYEDSWGKSRNYGGKRIHEGTDIMTSNNVRGYFPIVSVSDGIVEKKGWLKLGGYRIGVRSASGAYFYYAHLANYSGELEEGSKVKAGQLLGYMGDSGYGKEGTVGKFDVHLHFGIYIKIGKNEVSVNPYEVLNRVKKKRVSLIGLQKQNFA